VHRLCDVEKIQMVVTVVAGNANEVTVPVVGGSLESGGCWCVWRNLASVAVKMFSHLIYFTKKIYKFCTFSVICKDNAALNCITVQHKKSFIPVNFDGSYASCVILS
jgi:hypothetical protein